MVCQVEIDKTNEPTIGPRIGPNELIAIKNDMKEVNSTPWYLSQAMARVSTIPPAAEIPCKIQQKIKISTLGEIAQKYEDRVIDILPLLKQGDSYRPI